MQLDDYLDRIRWHGPVTPTLDTLGGILRAQSYGVVFENLDVQLGRPLTTSIRSAYDKIVDRRRGGWCYEQNGLLGWALESMGFDVTRIAAAVMRAERGEVSTANHLALLVSLPGDTRAWLVDVGFGGSLGAPLPLEACSQDHAPFQVGLRRLDDGYWQFWEDDGDGEFTFDFEATAADEKALEARCTYLQTSPDSGFVKNAVCQLRRPTSHITLRGRVLTTLDENGKKEQLLGSAAEMVAVLDSTFGLSIPEAAGLWDKISARHTEHFGDRE
jgi:N-hydroxyarylamine O-acetyltransferase